MPDHPAVQTSHLGRVYRQRRRWRQPPAPPRVALHDVNLTILRGECFGVLGPNGAGKTTLIKILTTLLAPSSGAASVAGYDVTREAARIRPRINTVSGGEASGYGILTVRENLWMFAQFYGISSSDANRRIRELLDVLKLADRLNTKSSVLSTGLRQKMNIARGFLTDLEIIFLDEPTLGLDVGASRDVRAFVRAWRNEDPTRTVLLTTHDMMEADDLCDRIAIVNGGRVLACDTLSALKKRLRRECVYRLDTTPLDDGGLATIVGLQDVASAVHTEHERGATLELIVHNELALGRVLRVLEERRVGLVNLTKREPTLEDVFVQLVGQSMQEVEHAGEPAIA